MPESSDASVCSWCGNVVVRTKRGACPKCGSVKLTPRSSTRARDAAASDDAEKECTACGVVAETQPSKVWLLRIERFRSGAKQSVEIKRGGVCRRCVAKQGTFYFLTSLINAIVLVGLSVLAGSQVTLLADSAANTIELQVETERREREQIVKRYGGEKAARLRLQQETLLTITWEILRNVLQTVLPWLGLLVYLQLIIASLIAVLPFFLNAFYAAHEDTVLLKAVRRSLRKARDRCLVLSFNPGGSRVGIRERLKHSRFFLIRFISRICFGSIPSATATAVWSVRFCLIATCVLMFPFMVMGIHTIYFPLAALVWFLVLLVSVLLGVLTGMLIGALSGFIANIFGRSMV